MTSDFARQALALHNKYRAQHNAPPLEWCQELERGARDHAASLLNRPEGEPLSPKKGLNLGQNVFELRKKGQGLEQVDDVQAIERAIDTWYADLNDYDPNQSGSKGRSFSQLVWRSTKRVGLGIARRVTAGSMNIIVIGFYDPPGNYQGEFESNVTIQKSNIKSIQHNSHNTNQWDNQIQNRRDFDSTNTNTNNTYDSNNTRQINTQNNYENRRDDFTTRQDSTNRRDLQSENSQMTSTRKIVTTEKNIKMEGYNSNSLDDTSLDTLTNERDIQNFERDTQNRQINIHNQNAHKNIVPQQQQNFENTERRESHSTEQFENSTSTSTTTKKVTTAFKNIKIEQRGQVSSDISQDFMIENNHVNNVFDRENLNDTTTNSTKSINTTNTNNKETRTTKDISQNYPQSTPQPRDTMPHDPNSHIGRQQTTMTTCTKKTVVHMTSGGEFEPTSPAPSPAPVPTSNFSNINNSNIHQSSTQTKTITTKSINMDNNMTNTIQNSPQKSLPDPNQVDRVIRTTETSTVKTKEVIETLRVAVQLHNEIRRKHGAPDVTVDDELCQQATTYAKSIITKTEKKETVKVGRNVYQMNGSTPEGPEAIKKAIDKWYSKKEEYNWDDPLNSGQGAKLFTQLVWKSCKTIGVAVETCHKTKTTAVVVLYSPAGNITSDQRYKENVQRA